MAAHAQDLVLLCKVKRLVQVLVCNEETGTSKNVNSSQYTRPLSEEAGLLTVGVADGNKPHPCSLDPSLEEEDEELR